MTDVTATMTEIRERGYAHPEVLVSTDWVAEHLNDRAVRLIGQTARIAPAVTISSCDSP